MSLHCHCFSVFSFPFPLFHHPIPWPLDCFSPAQYPFFPSFIFHFSFIPSFSPSFILMFFSFLFLVPLFVPLSLPSSLPLSFLPPLSSFLIYCFCGFLLPLIFNMTHHESLLCSKTKLMFIMYVMYPFVVFILNTER